MEVWLYDITHSGTLVSTGASSPPMPCGTLQENVNRKTWIGVAKYVKLRVVLGLVLSKYEPPKPPNSDPALEARILHSKCTSFFNLAADNVRRSCDNAATVTTARTDLKPNWPMTERQIRLLLWFCVVYGNAIRWHVSIQVSWESTPLASVVRKALLPWSLRYHLFHLNHALLVAPVI